MKQLTMTKVLTPLAALAFAFGVQAAVPSADGFETYAENASVTNATGWSFEAGSDGADDASFVTTYTTAGIATPASHDGATAGSNFLKLSTEDGKLFRNMDGASGQNVQPNAGLYVDTDVQFTITDHSDQPEVTAEDKFIIWLEDNNGSTNLCAWAGSYDASGVLSSNVFTLVDSAESDTITIAPNTWHRLTVKAISNVNAGGSATIPGFQVYVDGHLFKTTEFVADGAFVSGLESAAAALINDDMTFLPAMTSMPYLTKVGFSGEGAIDNVVVTREEPGFTNPINLTFEWDDGAPFTSVYLSSLDMTLTSTGTVRVASSLNGTTLPLVIAGTDLNTYDVKIDDVLVSPAAASITAANKSYRITATAKDTVQVAFTMDTTTWTQDDGSGNLLFTYIQSVMVGDEDITATVIAGDPANIPLKVGTNVTVAVTLSSPVAAPTLAPSEATELTVNGFNIAVNEFGDGAAAIAIVASTPKAFVNGQPYATLAEVLAAANAAGTATIELADNVTIGDVAVASGKNITIDLAGNDITGAAEAAAVFSVADGGTLTITNSTEDVGIVSKGSATACISNAGTLNLQAGKFDIDGGAISGGTINVTGGFYNAATFAGATLPEGMDLAADTGIVDTYQYVLAVDNSVARIAGGAKYDTLAGAIADAAAGDTVIVLADCVVTNPITFTQGITVSNDYTVSINTYYALRIANGTTTPVTFCGTGSYVWTGGSGSPILVGCNEVKAANAGQGDPTGISSFYQGSFVLNGNTLTSTDATAKGGNLVKLEDGTFVLNSGTVNGGTRGVKADSEKNNATCVLTINGGTIVNTNSAAIAATTAGSGSSTVTVNAGTFTGLITGTGMVTIPGTSTAQFDRDQTAFCAAGYKTVLSDGWYVVTEKVYYTAISLSTNALELVTNETYTLTATLTPASAADDSVTWTSSDDTVATVANGVVTAVGAGTATITAATANYSATCAVTVTAPSPAAAGWVDDSSAIEANTSAATQYPDLASSALATADAKELTDWAKDNSIAFADVAADTSGTYVEAFLLNCAVADVAEEKAEFKANITVNADGTVTVTAPDGKDYNGTLQLKGKAALTDAEWTDVSTPSSSYKFYKYELSL